MRAGRPSRTAEQNAAFRAAESARPSGVRLLNDPYAAQLLPTGLRLLALLSSVPIVGGGLNWFVDTRWPGARSSIIARTRLIDEWLCAAIRVGVQQVVLLGAGFDSRAWRLSALADACVFEVGHPATSAEKRRRLAGLGADVARVRLVAVDFDRQMPADGLVQAGFDPSRRAVVIWDGVTNYLQPEAVDAITRWVGGLADGGQFIFTYIHSGVLDGSMSFEGAAAILRAVRRSGEPWTFGMHPNTVAHYLECRGLRLLADLGADEYRRKVLGGTAQQIRGYGFYHAALTEIRRTNPIGSRKEQTSVISAENRDGR
jgi:methyltransferase (TIGR00027 family)